MTPQASTNKVFPVVSMGKFTTLYFITMGWYSAFWLYQCWRSMEQDSGRKLFPILRTLFSIFFVHELFSYVQKKEDQSNPYPWRPSSYAWIFIGAGFCFVCLTFLSEHFKLNSLFRLIFFTVFLFVQYIALYKVQLVINRLGQDPFGSSNSKLTLENNLWGAFGLYIWLSSFYTCYLEMTGQITLKPLFETHSENQGNTPPDTAERQPTEGL